MSMSIDPTEFSRKDIDKRKIIIKKSVKNLEIDASSSRKDTKPQDEESEEGRDFCLSFLKINTMELQILRNRELDINKTPAISFKTGFIDAMKNFTQSNHFQSMLD